MVKEIVHDPFILRMRSEDASAEDIPVMNDLADTLLFHKKNCVGMAANMIGVKKRIIIVNMGPVNVVMFNPVITQKQKPYDTEEGCLSLEGIRKTKRYRSVKVRYQNQDMQTRFKTFTGWTAQIIQHEIDHCNGILI